MPLATKCHEPITGDLTNIKGFKVANLNVNSLMKRIDEIRHLPVSLDIFAVNESKIDESIQ